MTEELLAQFKMSLQSFLTDGYLIKYSWPDEPLWILQCANATCRVRLVPDMAARIEQFR